MPLSWRNGKQSTLFMAKAKKRETTKKLTRRYNDKIIFRCFLSIQYFSSSSSFDSIVAFIYGHCNRIYVKFEFYLPPSLYSFCSVYNINMILTSKLQYNATKFIKRSRMWSLFTHIPNKDNQRVWRNIEPVTIIIKVKHRLYYFLQWNYIFFSQFHCLE